MARNQKGPPAKAPAVTGTPRRDEMRERQIKGMEVMKPARTIEGSGMKMSWRNDPDAQRRMDEMFRD